MRFTSLICAVFLFGSSVLTKEEYNRLYYAASMINELLQYFETMLDEDIKFDFSPDIKSIKEEDIRGKERDVQNKDQLPEDQVKKRISLHERCVKKARYGFLYLVKKKNTSIGNVFQVFFSGDNEVQYESEMAENRTVEAFEIALEMKRFFFHEMPKYYNELGKNMSIDFTEEEIKRSEKVIRDGQEQSKKDILHIMKEMGVDMP